MSKNVKNVKDNLLELKDLLHHEIVLVLHEEGVVTTRVPGIARVKPKITIYAPRIYTALYIMLSVRAYPLRGHESITICTHPKHYAQGCINHRCIGGFMLLCTKAHEGGFRAHTEGGGGAGA